MQEYCESKNPDYIVGIESRGFIFGAAIADRMGIGFIPVRKKGKLPSETVEHEYELEYGSGVIEMHADAIEKGQSVVIVDDLIATGGTLDATCKLIEKIGAEVAGITVLIDLAFLPWRDKVGDREVFALIKYDSE
jgi:adenine phosphoribosyltransferase